MRSSAGILPALDGDRSIRSPLNAPAHRLLLGNWREGERDGRRYAFTCPSTPRYRHQWYWDSCFHTIVWRHFDPARARAELRTLLSAGDPDGFVPRTVFWDRPARWRRAPLYATARAFGSWRTASTETPLLATAWELVAEASDDEPAFAAEALGALRAHHDWLAEHRDPDGDGLISIIFPDESGLDDSPKYEPVFGRMTHDRPGYFRLVDRCRRLGYDGCGIIVTTDEHVEDILVNTAYALSARALARLCAAAGDTEGAAAEHARAERTEAALLERCWDDERGLFFDLAGRDERRIEISTWSSLAPLALPSLPRAYARRLIEDHLLDPSRYGFVTGVPSVSMDEPSFNPHFDRYRTWRGPSWVNTAWLLVPAMRRWGYEAEADRIVSSLVAAIERHGFREYYDPLTGRGMAARGFGWSTLVVDLT